MSAIACLRVRYALVLATMHSQNPIRNGRVIQYSYGHGWTRESIMAEFTKTLLNAVDNGDSLVSDNYAKLTEAELSYLKNTDDMYQLEFTSVPEGICVTLTPGELHSVTIDGILDKYIKFWMPSTFDGMF